MWRREARAIRCYFEEQVRSVRVPDLPSLLTPASSLPSTRSGLGGAVAAAAACLLLLVAFRFSFAAPLPLESVAARIHAERSLERVLPSATETRAYISRSLQRRVIP